MRREGQSAGLGGTTRRGVDVNVEADRNRSLQAAGTSTVMNSALSGAGVMLIAGMRSPMGLVIVCCAEKGAWVCERAAS